MQYWVFKHTYDKATENDIHTLIDKCLKNNFCMCHYEYDDVQDKGQVTKNWRFLKEVKVGDIIILSRAGSKIAWGYAIKPRFENSNLKKVKLNCKEIMNTKTSNLPSDNYNGYIEFEDCECFYENLEDGKWGQRIDVDKWNDYNKNGISYPIDTNYRRNAIYPILNKQDALNIVRKLRNDENFQFKEQIMEDCKKLLLNNYNLILTGAPGTGKTYLAKQIAAKIIFNDNNKEYTEDLENDTNFKNQCKFVQFHPSYDYTDFVEGLRPKDDKGNIGFERKDGVFKEFCKKALRNLINSKKDIPELNREAVIKKYLIEFANEKYNEFNKSENKQVRLDGISGKPVAPFTNIEFNEGEEMLLMVAEAKNEYPIKGYMYQYVDWYKKYKELQKQEKLTTINMGKEVSVGNRISYLCAILKDFDEKYNFKIEEELKNGTTMVEKVERKNFVFIIDEINRGEISKIFGELFFAIDPGYRGENGKVKTQYNNLINEDGDFEDGFFVPENVYIIGTMNDIDRSVESMDFAMRRRFAFREIKAKDTQENILKSLDGSIKQDAINRMNNLNNAIEKIESFNSSYHIGASYFLKLENYYNGNNEEQAFNSLWENHLEGLLFEYLRGMPDAKNELDKLKNAYNNKVSDNNATQDNSVAEDSNINSNDTKQNDSTDNQ